MHHAHAVTLGCLPVLAATNPFGPVAAWLDHHLSCLSFVCNKQGMSSYKPDILIPIVTLHPAGDVAMLRDGQLYGTVPALSADTAHSSNVECLVVICDRPVAAAAIAAAATATAPSSSNQASGSLGGGLGYSPGCLEAIQVSFGPVPLHHVLTECVCTEVKQAVQQAPQQS